MQGQHFRSRPRVFRIQTLKTRGLPLAKRSRIVYIPMEVAITLGVVAACIVGWVGKGLWTLFTVWINDT